MKIFENSVALSKILMHSIIVTLLIGCSKSSESTSDNNSVVIIEEEKENSLIELNLRVHIMQDILMTHATGVVMDSWISPEDINEIILPEVNAIYEQADIHWNSESIINEEVVKTDTYQQALNFIVNTNRDANGNSNPARLPLLFSMMQNEHMSSEAQLGKNLFHIYLFPFIGNTSQGNAMSGFNYHSVVGTWTNKHNGGGTPERTLLVERQNSFDRGSLSRTIAHELGHVLSLKHNECANNCLMAGTNSDGYLLAEGQIIMARIEAIGRSFD